jgi:hypothetical protein
MYRISFILSAALALTACSTDNVHEFSGASDTDSGLVDDGPQIYDGFGDEDTGDFGDEDTGEQDGGPQDLDGDGYTQDVDCDETDADINPGATEQCDGIDNDCDGLVDDEDGLDCDGEHVDNDGDGATTLIDCDDEDASVYPGAEEIEDDGIDQDCDGEDAESSDTGDTGASDEDTGDTGEDADTGDTGSDYDPDTEDSDGDGWVDSSDCDPDDASVGATSTWYADADGDGYGDPDSTESACDEPSGYVEDSTDCDDTDANVNPEQDEVFDNGTDDNCDGEEDEGISAYVEATYSSSADLTLSVWTWSSGSAMESNVWGESESGESVSSVELELTEADNPLSCGLRISVDANGSDWSCQAWGLDSSFSLNVWTPESDWLAEDELDVWIADNGSGSCSLYVQTNSDSNCDPVDDE